MTASTALPATRPRRGYVDWLRGLAVLVMIEAHILDSWTLLSDKQGWKFAWSIILGGFGAPLFLFLAGVTVPLSAAAKHRKTANASAAARSVMIRGLEIFGLAFLFRIQAWILWHSAAWRLLKVDILNIMGPSIVAAAALWGAVRSPRGRYVAFALATVATTLLTPLVWATTLLDPLPDPVEAYFHPAGGLTAFAFFPWSGFVFAGALVGMAIEQSASAQRERLLNAVLFAGGSAMAILAYGGSFLPSLYPKSEFWGSSPAFFFLRLGILIAAVGVSYAWQLRRTVARWSPVQQLGRTSFFIYWIHVEMVYGLISLPLHGAMTFKQVWIAYAAFALFMLACSIGKDRFVERWRRRQSSFLLKRQEDLRELA